MQRRNPRSGKILIGVLEKCLKGAVEERNIAIDGIKSWIGALKKEKIFHAELESLAIK